MDLETGKGGEPLRMYDSGLTYPSGLSATNGLMDDYLNSLTYTHLMMSSLARVRRTPAIQVV